MTAESTDTTNPASHSKRQEVRRWVLAVALILAILCPLYFMIAALGTRFGLWSWQFSLGTLIRNVGPNLLIACLLAGVAALLSAAIIKPRRGFVVAIVAILIPVLAFAHLRNVQNTARTLPFIHDITTNTQDPPVFGPAILAERRDTDGVNTVEYAGKRVGGAETPLVSALQTKSYPEIRTLVLNEKPSDVFERAQKVVRDLGWSLKDVDADTGRIDATDTTFWFGFKDDVTIRLRPAQGGGTVVDARSVSRVGGSDLGANADRLKRFLDAMAG